LFVANGGGAASIAAFVINPSTGALTSVEGSPYYWGGSGIVVADNGLVIATSYYAQGSGTLNSLRINLDCSLTELTIISTFPYASPAGMKVTPNGKYLLVTTGTIQSYQIDYDTGSLSEIGSFGAYQAASLEISCDSSTVYVGSGGAIEILSIDSNGAIGDLGVFYPHQSANNFLINADGQTLFISDAMGSQILALKTGPNGSLAPGTPTKLKGSPMPTMNMTMGMGQRRVYVAEQGGIGILNVKGVQLTEVVHSPVAVSSMSFPGVLEFPSSTCATPR
jgi:hypothetical protein